MFQAGLQTAAQHAELMHRVESYNLLHDSNKLLREERDQLQTKLTQSDTKVSTFTTVLCLRENSIIVEMLGFHCIYNFPILSNGKTYIMIKGIFQFLWTALHSSIGRASEVKVHNMRQSMVGVQAYTSCGNICPLSLLVLIVAPRNLRSINYY